MSYARLSLRGRQVYLHKLFTQKQSFHSSSPWQGRATPLEDASKLVVGSSLHGYTVKSVSPVPDFSLTAVQLVHDKTGAQHLHLARKDSNNAFSVGFRTTPMDSTGVAHILEHTTLCGSQKYPVRDPFFKMLTRSLSTFMNAFTASDWTMYPFSSQNEKDFRNLLSVYLDCVFFPQLREIDFKQEAWRLEHEDPSNRSSPIVFKGVVYNEMKGHFANSPNIYAQALQNRLFPSHTYSHISGGWPPDILNLTYEKLKNFHLQHYHPSNAKFFTYGDLPLADHLQLISQHVLNHFGRSTESLSVPLETKWTEPRAYHINCPPDPMAPDPTKQTTTSISFLLPPITDPYESLVIGILGQLLVGGPASPFYEALIDADIGSDFAPSTGVDSTTKEASFTVGLQGIKEEDVEKVRNIVWDTFEKVASEGFPEDRIRAVLHQIELGIKHESTNFGLHLISSLITPWIHDADPVSMMEINKNVERFKVDMKKPDFLTEKIRHYFLNNKHHLLLTMTPDEKYEDNLLNAEKERLDQMLSSLGEKQKEELYEQGLALQADQNKPENKDCLPTLHTSDVDKYIKFTHLDEQQCDGVPILCLQQPTNGVTYFRAITGITSLPLNLRIYIPLFCSVITRMGAGDLDHRQFAQECDLYTSGLSVSPHVCSHHTAPLSYEQGVLFHSHSLERHIPRMLSLWEDVFTEPNLTDLERLKVLVNMAASNLATSISNSGHSFAISAAASGLSPSAALSEIFGGLTQAEFLKTLAEKKDLQETMQAIANVAATVLDSGDLRCAVNTTPEAADSTLEALGGFVSTIPGTRTDSSSHTEEAEFKPSGSNTFYEMPFPVNYVARAYRTVPYTHKDSARLMVLAKLMSSKFLHREIREKGGAYGSGARQGQNIFTFHSYRDPNSFDTLNRFQGALEWAAKGSYSDSDIEEAKLAVFSQVDAPVSPGAKGATYFLTGVSDEMRQKLREHLFTVKKQDMETMVTRYFTEAVPTGSVIIGPSNGTSLPSGWIVKNVEMGSH